MFFIKKLKRKCAVKGCKNVNSYAISAMSEFGGVNICRDCLEKAVKEVQNAECKMQNMTAPFTLSVSSADSSPGGRACDVGVSEGDSSPGGRGYGEEVSGTVTERADNIRTYGDGGTSTNPSVNDVDSLPSGKGKAKRSRKK